MEEWYQSNKVSFQRNRGCMVNYRNVSYALGVLVLVEAGFFALCAGVSFYYQEEDYIHFLETLLINVVLGGLLLLGVNEMKYPSIDVTVIVLSVFRGYCFRHWECFLSYLVDIFHQYPMPFLKPCQGSPLPVPRYWIISKPFPTDCCSGEV